MAPPFHPLNHPHPGGGGLLAGTAVAIKNLKPEVQIIGVEPEVVPSFSTALQEGKPVFVGAKATLADSLAVPQVSTLFYFVS